MIKMFIRCLIVLMTSGLMPANAETSLTYGAKVQGNMSNFLLKDINAESRVSLGITFGGYGKIEFNDNFALRSELLFHLKNSEIKENNTEQILNFEYFGIELPIYVLGHKPISNGKGFIGIGPYVGFGFNANYNIRGANSINPYKDNIMQRWDLGVGGIIGYELSKYLLISAVYNRGLINLLDKESNDSKILNQAFSLGLGFIF